LLSDDNDFQERLETGACREVLKILTYIDIPRTSGCAKLSLEVETTLIYAVSLVFSRFTKLSPFDVKLDIAALKVASTKLKQTISMFQTVPWTLPVVPSAIHNNGDKL